MKIAHIAPPWISVPPRTYGGTEAVISALVEEQVAQGHEVTLFTTGDSRTSARCVSFLDRSLVEAGVPWGAHLKAYYHLAKSVREIQGGDFEIVHGHLSSASDVYLFPLFSSLAIPRVVTLHSTFPFDRLGSWTGDADRYYIDEWANVLPFVAISESSRSQVPYPLHFVGTVHNGVALEHFRVSSRRLKSCGEYFVWIGRFSPEKGAHLAITAAKRAGVSLVLAGTVDRSSKEATDYFYKIVRPQVDGQQIHYQGPVNMRQKIKLLGNARGFLNPIEWEEPFGMVMIESMAMGCPVISFSRGAAPEIVKHGETGFLVTTLEEMIACIPDICELDRECVRKHVASHFSSRVMEEKYLAIYNQLSK
jgi:glycosyltransferase involved in cell wall biosynthesis